MNFSSAMTSSIDVVDPLAFSLSAAVYGSHCSSLMDEGHVLSEEEKVLPTMELVEEYGTRKRNISVLQPPLFSVSFG